MNLRFSSLHITRFVNQKTGQTVTLNGHQKFWLGKAHGQNNQRLWEQQGHFPTGDMMQYIQDEELYYFTPDEVANHQRANNDPARDRLVRQYITRAQPGQITFTPPSEPNGNDFQIHDVKPI